MKWSTLHHIHGAQTIGQQGWKETLPMRATSQETKKERKRWSAWATGEDGRWLSTTALKRQNVAHNSDRCSLITAACQHLQQRTVVVFEVDPGPVMFCQSQSFSEQNKSSISADLPSNHIHRCSNGADLRLKIRDKWAAQQKSCSFSSRSLSSSSRDSVARGPVVLTLPSTGHFLASWVQNNLDKLKQEHLKALILSGLSRSSSNVSSETISAIKIT